MTYIISNKCKKIGGYNYMIIPSEVNASDVYMVRNKKDLPSCTYPVRITTRFNQGWAISNCHPSYDLYGNAYAEIYLKKDKIYQ